MIGAHNDVQLCPSFPGAQSSTTSTTNTISTTSTTCTSLRVNRPYNNIEMLTIISNKTRIHMHFWFGSRCVNQRGDTKYVGCCIKTRCHKQEGGGHVKGYGRAETSGQYEQRYCVICTCCCIRRRIHHLGNLNVSSPSEMYQASSVMFWSGGVDMLRKMNSTHETIP
jgi:hypothetical protein